MQQADDVTLQYKLWLHFLQLWKGRVCTESLQVQQITHISEEAQGSMYLYNHLYSLLPHYNIQNDTLRLVEVIESKRLEFLPLLHRSTSYHIEMKFKKKKRGVC